VSGRSNEHPFAQFRFPKTVNDQKGSVMFRTVTLHTAMISSIVLVGCKTASPITQESSGDIKPALLIGPDAIGKAPPPTELPNKESARLCIRTAQEYEKNGQTEEAIKLFEKARAIDPTIAKTCSRRLAVLYDSTGDFGKAMTEYEALLKANPKDADLHNDLGYSYYCRGEWANAESALLKAVQYDPNHKRAWINLGLTLAQLGKWDESFQAFCKVVRPAEAHSNFAFILAAQGKTIEAKAQYREALSLDPNLRVAQTALGRLERPQTPESQSGRAVPVDPAIAAAQVPSIEEIEARMKLESAVEPVVAPVPDAKPSDGK
jgi:tetratricopeptide (TPR) repeat protein